MESPKITWQIKKKKDSSYKEETDYFAGVYNQTNNIDLEMCWRGREVRFMEALEYDI